MDLIERLRAGENFWAESSLRFDSKLADAVAEAADEIERRTTELAKHQKSAAWCDKHKPNGGHRTVCVICAGEKLSAALSRISYLCGGPNEMECSAYDVFPDEDAVVAQVQSLTKERDALKQELDLRRKSGSASDRLHNICEGLREDADSSPFSREEWDRLDAENAALRKERDALRLDAERFRWLRDESQKKHDFYSDAESWMVSRQQGGMECAPGRCAVRETPNAELTGPSENKGSNDEHH